MQELEKILEEIEEQRSYEADHAWNYAKGLEHAANIIRKHMNDGWIPVEDHLPEEPSEEDTEEDDFEEYIVMIDGAQLPTSLKYAGDGNWCENGAYYHVIAWQPLPDPYRPERSKK